jgi:ABC-type lipoprotein release transport system permease subunit
MNPLSTRTYFNRHKGHAVMLLSISMIVTLAVFSMVALVWGVFVEPGRLAYMRYSEFSMVTPWSEQGKAEPAVISEIRSHPDVADVLPTMIIRIDLPGAVSGNVFQFELCGLMEENVPTILSKFETHLTEGKLPSKGTNELLLSADVANMLNVKVGDTYDILSTEFYPNIEDSLQPTPFIVTGILESEVELGIVSLEHLNQHELYSQFPSRFIVLAKENKSEIVDSFLRDEILSLNTSVLTLSLLNERIINEALPGLLMLLPVILIVSIAFSLIIVVINQIVNQRRLPEFGILHAIGLSRNWLNRRLTKETGILAFAGWILGIALARGTLHLLKVSYFAPQGHNLKFPVWLPILFSFIIPIAIAAMTFLTVRRTFRRLDPVSIIEQGALSQEEKGRQQNSVSESSIKPLSPWTYYSRHRRRGALLISGMGVMILALVLMIFTLAIDADAKLPFVGYLHQVSILRSAGGSGGLDPEIAAQVEGHPSVERVIPYAPRIAMINVSIPPFSSSEASPFGIYADDMAYLVDLYSLTLQDGHLPRPGTNEIVIPVALAKNRDLEVGDVIGDPNQPAYPGAPSLTNQFVISGIFSQSETAKNESRWGFFSLEFLEESGILPLPDNFPLIVVPKEGQKEALDDWLEGEFAGSDISVLTHRLEVSRIQQEARQNMSAIALLESLIAIVAALGLAVLNYIYTSQRQPEFGVLYALGYGRRKLVGRVFGETSTVIGVAWVISALVSILALFVLRFGLYEPRGLSFDLINFTPWLYTLPIPFLVLLITTLSTARTLSKLDPISIIERRA